MVDPCLFILTINTLTPAYMIDRTTQISELGVGDKACVIELLTDDWMKVHWSMSGIGQTGFLHKLTVHKPTKATAPIPYEEHAVPPGAAPVPTQEPPTPEAPPVPNRGPTDPAAPPLATPLPAERTWTPPPPVKPKMPPLPPVKRESFRSEEDEPRLPAPKAWALRNIATAPSSEVHYHHHRRGYDRWEQW